MDEVFNMIEQADAEQIQRIIEKIRFRYSEICPGWELQFLTVQKGPDRGRQIDSVIGMLERLKSFDDTALRE